MKGKFIKCALTAALTLVLMSGAAADMPFAGILKNTLVTASAAVNKDVYTATDFAALDTNPNKYYLESGTYTLKSDVELGGYLYIDLGKDVTLDLNGHTLSRTDNGGRMIYVHNSGSLTLKDSSGNNSGRITGAHYTLSDYYGAVCVSGGKFTMLGGTISGNKAYPDYNGGGVDVSSNAEFVMTGGVIKDNSPCDVRSDGNAYIKTGLEVGTTAGTVKRFGNTVSVNAVANGTVTASEGTYTLDDTKYHLEGETVTLTAEPADGYYPIFTVTQNDGSNTKLILGGYGNTRTFTMPAYDVTVGTEFVSTPFIANAEDTEYTILNADGWNEFCTQVTDGNTFAGKTIKLDADISVSAMAGDGDHRFYGTFDGQGHTLSFNIDTDNTFTAPFRYVDGCTIKNLHVYGTITTTKSYAAGIVASLRGTVNMINCRSSVIIRGQGEKGYYGGLAGTVAASANLTIEGCVFDGKILYNGNTSASQCGGFVYSNSGTVKVKNSLYIPAELASGENEPTNTVNTTNNDKCYTFVRNTSSGKLETDSECYYYSRKLGTGQGKLIHTISADENLIFELSGEATEYDVSGITAYAGSKGLKYGDTLYAGKDEEVSLTFTPPENYKLDTMTVTNKNDSTTISTSITGNTGKFTMPYADVSVSATFAALPINETYKKLSTEDGNEEYGYCTDVNGNNIYLIYKLTVTNTSDLENYDYVAVTDNSGKVIEPTNKTEGQDGYKGEFRTLYKSVKFNDNSTLTTDDNRYIIAFKIPNMTTAPQNFKIMAVEKTGGNS